MNLMAKLMWVVVFTAASALLPVGVFAQESEPPAVVQAASPSAEDPAKQMQAQAESALAAFEADSGIEDSVKNLLRSKYGQAIEALKQATVSTAKAAEYRESMTLAPARVAELRVQLKELPSVENAGDVTAPDKSDDLQQELDAKRAALAALNEQLSNVTADPSLAEQRPADISVRIPEAERELADARTKLASPDLAEDNTSPGRVADRFLLQARELMLLGELEMLKQEQLSRSVRRSLQQAQKELLTRQVENASASVAGYQALMDQRIAEAAQDIRARASESKREVPQDDQGSSRAGCGSQGAGKPVRKCSSGQTRNISRED